MPDEFEVPTAAEAEGAGRAGFEAAAIASQFGSSLVTSAETVDFESWVEAGIDDVE